MSKHIRNILPKLPFTSNSFLSSAPSSSPDFIIEHISSNNRLPAAYLQKAPKLRRSNSADHPLSNSTNKFSNNTPAKQSNSALVNAPSPKVLAHGLQKEIELYDSAHCLYTLDYLNSLREQGDLCDVTFKVDNCEIHAHRNILTGATNYFEGMFLGEFAETDSQAPIEIEDLNINCFQLIISYIYTGRIKINDENVFDLFLAAKLMAFASLSETCNRFMFQILAACNCIRIRRLAREFDCRALVEIAEEFIRQNFVAVSKVADFLILSTSELLEIIQIERLRIERDEVMYEIVMQWVSEEPKKRLLETSILFPQIRFIKMNIEFLESILLDPRLANFQDAKQFVETAIKRKNKPGEIVPPVPTKRGGKGTVLFKERPQVYSTHTVEIYRGGGLLGIKLLGGVDRPTHVLRREDVPGIYITEIQPFGAAHRYPDIQIGDRILAINGISLDQAAHSDVIQLLSICPDPVKITFRHEPVLLGLRDITLTRQLHEVFGIELASSGTDSSTEVVIASISADGAAARDHRIEPGLSVLHINSTNFASGFVSARQGNSIILCSGEQVHMLLADRRLEMEPDYLNFAPDQPPTTLPPPRPLPRIRMRAQTQIKRSDSPPTGISTFKPIPSVRTSFNVFEHDNEFLDGVDYEPLSDFVNTFTTAKVDEILIPPDRDSLFTVIGEDDQNPYSKLAPKPDNPILSIPSNLLSENDVTGPVQNPIIDNLQRENDPKATISSWDDLSDTEDMS